MHQDPRIQQHLDNLSKLITKTGLFLASSKNVETGYDKAWLRDNVYEALAFEYAGEWEVVEKDYHTRSTGPQPTNRLKAGNLFMPAITPKLLKNSGSPGAINNMMLSGRYCISWLILKLRVKACLETRRIDAPFRP